MRHRQVIASSHSHSSRSDKEIVVDTSICASRSVIKAVWWSDAYPVAVKPQEVSTIETKAAEAIFISHGRHVAAKQRAGRRSDALLKCPHSRTAIEITSVVTHAASPDGVLQRRRWGKTLLRDGIICHVPAGAHISLEPYSMEVQFTSFVPTRWTRTALPTPSSSSAGE